MKITRRDERLDKLLNRVVKIEFKDGSFVQGFFTWNEKPTSPLYLKSQCYFLVTDKATYWLIRKSHVKRVTAVQGETR